MMHNNGKAPLVLLPGHLCTALMWEAQISALSDTTQCIVPCYNKGRSMAEFARHILNEIPLPHFSLAGFSMGGFVAMEMLRQAPERISRLALIGTRPDRDTAERIQHRQRHINAVKERGLAAVFPEISRNWMHRNHQQNYTLIATLQQMAMMTGDDGFLRQEYALIQRHDAQNVLATVRCPTLIIAGEDDLPNPPGKQKLMAQLIPHAQYINVPGCGHLLPMESPQVLVRALHDWLST